MCLAQIFEAPKFSLDLFQIQNSLILARTYTIFAEVAEIQPVQHHPQVETLATRRDMIKIQDKHDRNKINRFNIVYQ